MAPGGGSSPTRTASTARVTRATISGRASSVPATRWRKRSTAWSVTATSTRRLQHPPVADLDDAGLRLALLAVQLPAVALVQRAAARVLAERPQQRRRVTGAAQHLLGVAQQRAGDLVAGGDGGLVAVQDPGLAVDDAAHAHDRAVALRQPGLAGAHAVPQADAVVERRHPRLVDVAGVLGAPRPQLQLRDGVHVPRGDRADGHGARFLR